KPVAIAKLRAYGLDGYLDLDLAAFGEEHDVRGELIGLAQQRARARYDIDRAVVIGDSKNDVKAGHAHGAFVVAVATGPTSAEDLASVGADVVLTDLSDLDRLRTLLIG